MKDIIKQLVTESDNTTHDIFRYLAILTILVGIGLMTYSVIVRGQAFDFLNFGSGVGALLGGVGIALGLKKETGAA